MAKIKLKTFTEQELRDSFYPMFCKLMDDGYEIEAYLFILESWNSMCFNFNKNKFSLDMFVDTIKRLDPLFRKMNDEDLAKMNIDQYARDIKTIFNTLNDIKGIQSTGASKLMHLKLRKVFIMWDRHIRNHYCYRNGNSDEYVDFLKAMQSRFSDCEVPKDRTLAKAIDEHNYINYTLLALEKTNKKK